MSLNLQLACWRKWVRKNKLNSEQISSANLYLTIVSIIITAIGIVVSLVTSWVFIMITIGIVIIVIGIAIWLGKHTKKVSILTEPDRFNEMEVFIQKIRDCILNIQSIMNPNNRKKGENPIKKINGFGEEIKMTLNDLKRVFPNSQVNLLVKGKRYNSFINSIINAKKVGEIKLDKISAFDNYLDEIQTSIKKEQAKSVEELS